MSRTGWIKLSRGLEDHWLWNDKPFSKGQAWIDLLFLANHKDEKFVFRGKLITGKRGCVYRSISFLSERWGWDRKKTVTFLKLLESDGMVTTDSTTHGTTVTIVNYGKYQNLGSTDGTTDGTSNGQPMGQPMDNHSPTDGTTTPHIQEYKEPKEPKNIGIGYNFTSVAEAVPTFSAAPLPSQEDLNQITQAWNTIPHAVKLSSIAPMTRRYDKLREAIAIVGMDGIMKAIQSVKESDWLAKRGHATFEHWITPDRVQGLIEGTYKDIYTTENQGGGYVELKRDW